MNRVEFDITAPNGFKHFKEQLDLLVKYNHDISEQCYNDIHTFVEGGTMVIEWETIPFCPDYVGHFKYIKDDHTVVPLPIPTPETSSVPKKQTVAEEWAKKRETFMKNIKESRELPPEDPVQLESGEAEFYYFAANEHEENGIPQP